MTADAPRPRAGIIAAGVGARLASAAGTPKALTIVAGRPLIEWVIDRLEVAGVQEVVAIINADSTEVQRRVTRRRGMRIDWIVETTPSSMHSFLRVVERLAANGDAGPFLISTVDTVAPPATYRMFVERARDASDDVVLGLTQHIDDETPVRVQVADPLVGGLPRITRLGADGDYATAGYYLVRPSVLREADAARADGLDALRHFFSRLVDRGYRFSGVGMPDSIDVDRPADVIAAEKLLMTPMA